MANPVTKPRNDETQVTQAALKALELATKHKTALDERLPAGLIDGLGTNLTALGVVIPGAKQAKTVAKAATVTQAEALTKGYASVTALRTLIKSSKASADVRKAYGVGSKVNPEVVKDVTASLKVIIDRAEANPTEAREFGILQRDIDALKANHTTITAADTTQEKQRAAAPQSTKARNLALRQVIDATERIAGAGIAEFAQDKATRAEFEALIGAGLPNKKPKKPTP